MMADPGPPHRSSTRTRARSLAGTAVVGVLDRVMRSLPTTPRLELRARTQSTTTLDHPTARVTLRADTAWELTRARACAKEPETVAWLERTVRSGDVLFDVGANVGAYGLLAHVLSGRTCDVYAFEPSALTYAVLVENIWLNRCADRVHAMPIALADVSTIDHLQLSAVDAGASLHTLGADGGAADAGASHAVVCLRMDDLVNGFGVPQPTMLKIDVDGAEERVLAGAAAVLADERLRSVLVELDGPPDEREQKLEPLLRAGFEVRGRHGRGGDGAGLRAANYILERG
jgi:FkbM family methyltransferase